MGQEVLQNLDEKAINSPTGINKELNGLDQLGEMLTEEARRLNRLVNALSGFTTDSSCNKEEPDPQKDGDDVLSRLFRTNKGLHDTYNEIKNQLDRAQEVLEF